VLGRMGGEEFALLLPQTGIGGAAQVAERLRSAVAAIRLPLAEGCLEATISLGVTTRLEGEAQFEHLLGRADRAMYEAKQAGRNRVAIEPGR
jgi:diguanylate cyclase (GGDEF)-like protein